MQYRQMEKILDDLAAVNSPIVVLVGNNLSVSEMEDRIRSASPSPKKILFGFGSTAGTREDGKLMTVHTGDGKLTVGRAHEEASVEEKALLKSLFKGSRLSISWCDNMDAWLKYHAAFILPVVYFIDSEKESRTSRCLPLTSCMPRCLPGSRSGISTSDSIQRGAWL